MAITRFSIFDSGGQQDLDATVGSPTITTNAARENTYGLRLAAGDEAEFSNSGARIEGVAIRFSSVSPSAKTKFWGTATSVDTFGLYLDTDGDVELRDASDVLIATITNPFTANIWVYVEDVVASGTNAFEVLFNGTSKFSDTGTYDITGGTFYAINETGSGITIDFNDYYHDETHTNPALGDFGTKGQQHSIGATATPTAGGLGGAGDDLDAGTWALTVDGDTGTNGEYTASGVYGSVDMDGPAAEAFRSTGSSEFNVGNIIANAKRAQSFQIASAADIKNVAIELRRVNNPTDNFIISIEADNSGEPSGTPLSSITIDASTISATKAYVEFTLASAASLSASTTYWLVFNRSGSLDGGDFIRLFGNAGGVYSGGAAISYNTSVWTSAGSDDIHFGLGEDLDIKAVKCLMNLKRDGGGGSTHYIFFGDSGDGNSPAAYDDDTDWGPITTSEADYFIVKNTDLPTASQNIRLGFGTGGAQDIHCYDMWSFVGFVPAAEDVSVTATTAQTLPAATQSATGAVEVAGVGASALPSLSQSADVTVTAPTVTATTTSTLPSLSQSAIGTSEVEATTAQVLPALIQASVAEVIFTATSAQELPALTQAATAEQIFEANVGQVLPSAEQSATTAIEVEATAASTLPSLTQDATAVETFSGVAAQTLPSMTQVVTTAIEVEATMAQTLPSVTQSVAGVFSTSIVTGTASQSLPAIVQDAAAAVEVAASTAQALPSLEQSATAKMIFEATGASELPSIVQASAAKLTFEAAVASGLPAATQEATAAIEVEGIDEQTLPSVVQSATSEIIFSATAASTLPSMSQSATAAAQVDASLTQALPSLTQVANATFTTNSVTGTAASDLPSMVQVVSANIGIKGDVAVMLPGITCDVSGAIEVTVAMAQTLPSTAGNATARYGINDGIGGGKICTQDIDVEESTAGSGCISATYS